MLRRRSRELPRSPLRHVAYTSALALIELIAGARESENQFARRRAAIEGIFRAELPVDWQLPDAKIACAFPRLRQKYDMFETRCGSLEALVTLLRKCNSAQEFSRRADALSLPVPLRYFEEFDATYGKDTSGDPVWPKEYRQLFEVGAVPTQFLGLSSTASYAEFMRAFQASAFNEIVMMEALAEVVAELAGYTDVRDIEELRKTYDGSIGPYLKALSYRHFEQAVGRQPGRNDAIDIAHFLYLVPGATLVTTDRSLAQLAVGLEIPCFGPGSVVAGA